MQILYQNRDLKNAVRKQLRDLEDTEKGKPEYSNLPGIETRSKEDGATIFIVSWSGEDDPQQPHNWTMLRRLKILGLLVLIAFTITAGSAIDSPVAAAAAEDYGVSNVTEALGGTGIFLVGFGIGALIASPLSELFGRYAVYVGTLAIFAIWEMASALAPNIGAQIAFRFLAGLCGSAPLTVAGGTLSDIFNAREKTWTFPLFAVVGFGGPTLGPVMAAYIPVTGVLSWHWPDWIILILTGVSIVVFGLFNEETLAPRLLMYKAKCFRQLTGDERFKAESELHGESVAQVLTKAFGRPFILALEPIVVAFTLYLSIAYIILFTFLDSYSYIFERTYGINSGLSNTIFVALFIGITLQLLAVPFIVRTTNKQLARDGDDGTGTKLNRESRLLFAMYSAPFLPVSLFWMGWTDYASISIWSPILASVLVGFSIISIFLSAYMYIIDSYEMYAASALTFVALMRYVVAGGMTVVGVPMYENLGTHYALTILACISAAAVPIPFALHKWGPKIRERSQYAIQPEH